MMKTFRPNLKKAVSYLPTSSPKGVIHISQPPLQTHQTGLHNPNRSFLQGGRPTPYRNNSVSFIGHTMTQVRFVHPGDMKVPNFDKYRRDSVKKPWVSSKCSEDARNNFTYLIVLAGSLGAAYSCKAMVAHYVTSMAASADVLALAQIEIKLAEIPVGKHVTFKWRGKPLFIWHRKPETIAEVRAVPVESLRHPERDEDRTQNEEWLVVIGVCTHLGCVPIADAGDYGGYYCPCHGSHYDASGRIRKGPAPTNLEVPLYSFPTEDTLMVG